MSNKPLSKIIINDWYKILPALGASVLIFALTVELVGVQNTAVQLISLGSIFIGIGEWQNHPSETTVMKQYKYTVRLRKNTWSGNIWNFAGSLLVFGGIWKILNH